MVKKIKRNIRKRPISDFNLEEVLLNLTRKGRHTFADTTYIIYKEVDGREAIQAYGPEGSRAALFGEMISAVGWGHAYKPEPEPEPEPEPVHKPAVVGTLDEFPVYHYSRLALVEGAMSEAPARESVETRELVEGMRQAQCFVPDPRDVVALHRSGSFLCWELSPTLFVIDDEGSQSACHVFSDKQLALNVLRGYTGRRAAKSRVGHVKSYNHTAGWLEKVENIILSHL